MINIEELIEKLSANGFINFTNKEKEWLRKLIEKENEKIVSEPEETEKEYVYFINASISKDGAVSEIATYATTKRKVKTFDDIIKISNEIKKEYGYDEIVIKNWKKFD